MTLLMISELKVSRGSAYWVTPDRRLQLGTGPRENKSGRRLARPLATVSRVEPCESGLAAALTIHSTILPPPAIWSDEMAAARKSWPRSRFGRQKPAQAGIDSPAPALRIKTGNFWSPARHT